MKPWVCFPTGSRKTWILCLSHHCTYKVRSNCRTKQFSYLCKISQIASDTLLPLERCRELAGGRSSVPRKAGFCIFNPPPSLRDASLACKIKKAFKISHNVVTILHNLTKLIYLYKLHNIPFGGLCVSRW